MCSYLNVHFQSQRVNIILLNVHAQSEKKSDDAKDSLYEELGFRSFS